MKRALAFLVIIAVLAWASVASAVGTVTATKRDLGPGKKVVVITWTADASAATVPNFILRVTTTATGASMPFLAECAGWYLYTGETNPGSTAPTDDYDMVLTDSDGVDLAGGLLANRDTSNSEIVNFGTGAAGYPVLRGDLTFSLSGNAVNSATGTLTLILVE